MAELKTAPMVWAEDEGDARKGPPCTRCGRPMKPGKPRFWVHVIHGGNVVLHPDSEADYAAADPGEMGWFPVGPECARKFGKGFAVTSETLDAAAGG